MTSDIGLEKLGGWRRLEQGWGRLWSGHTCLACLPVHVCAYDTCKWRRQRGSWGCRPQTQGQLRLEERVLCRESSNIQATGLGEALPSRCSTASRIIF